MFHSRNKNWIALYKGLLSFFIVSCFALSSFAQQPVLNADSTREDSAMVQKFYATWYEPLFWLSSRKNIKRAKEWLKVIETTNNVDYVPDKSQISQIHEALSRKNKMDNYLKEKTDRQLTGLVLNFIKYKQENNIHFEYDEVNVPQDSVYIFQLIFSRHKGPVSKIVSTLDCKDPDYLVLKKYLHDSITDQNSVKYKTVVLAMNYLKYFSMNHHSDYIVANIPETEVKYYQNSSLKLKMKSVAGKKKNPTPTIASYITDIVTFPFWNVPFSIASKELLPKVQKDETYLERNNFEVVDAKGNVVDDSDLNWADYTEKTFPYFFRESTGPNNSLGILKFNLNNPYSIFLHDTNSKGGFAKESRFLSHGCIRLEKPVELAELLTDGKIDSNALKTGKKYTESKTIVLEKKIPVFIIYMPLTVVGNKVTFLPDVYGLIK